MYKKGKVKVGFLEVVIIIVAIGVFLSLPATRNMFAGWGIELPGKEVDKVSISEACLGVEDIAMKINDLNRDAYGTDPGLSSAVSLDLDRDGTIEPFEDIGDVADDGSTTVPIELDYVVYGGWNAGTGGSYYVKKLTGNTNCQDPLHINPELAAIDTTVSFVVTNDDGTLNSATNLSLDAGEVTTISVEVKSTSKQYYGNPDLGKCNILLFEYNSTAYDSFEPVGDMIGGVAGEPKTHTIAGTSNTTASWYIGPISSVPQVFTINIDVAEADVLAAHGAGFSIDIYDCDYDLDADENTEIIGVEDEDGNDLGSATDQRQEIQVG